MAMAPAITPSKLQLLPAELLIKTATFLDTSEDLQSLRLVDRAFSNAGTTVLRERFFRLHVVPTRTSVSRFLNLTSNALIASHITELVILYRPPYASSAVPSDMVAASKDYNLPWPMCKEILSEFNSNCFKPVIVDDAGALPQETNVVEIGAYEQILQEGIEQLSALRSVVLRSGMNVPVEISSSLNLPEYLRYVDASTGVFDAKRYPKIADITRYIILRCLFMTRLGKGLPKDILGAFRGWQSDVDGRNRSLSFVISTRGSITQLREQRLRVVQDSLAKITRISLSLHGQDLSPKQTRRLETDGGATDLHHGGIPYVHYDKVAGPYWCEILQAASNLKSLEIVDLSSASVGISSLLNRVFKFCTWPHLTELSIVRTSNIKLLPLESWNSDYSMGWYLFLQKDLDEFLLRHKTTLERLKLQNILGIEESVTPPDYSLQYLGPEFPDDPTPSLPALRNSLALWKRGLSKLKKIGVLVTAKASYPYDSISPLNAWLPKSDIEALATTLGVEAIMTDSVEGQSKFSQVTFDLASPTGHTRGTPTDS